MNVDFVGLMGSVLVDVSEAGMLLESVNVELNS